MMVQMICDELKYGASGRLAPSSATMIAMLEKTPSYRDSICFSEVNCPWVMLSHNDNIADIADIAELLAEKGTAPGTALKGVKRGKNRVSKKV